MLRAFLPKKHKTQKYHLVTAELPFAVKAIDCMVHETALGREHSILHYVNIDSAPVSRVQHSTVKLELRKTLNFIFSWTMAPQQPSE